jgi:hypothetical protein
MNTQTRLSVALMLGALLIGAAWAGRVAAQSAPVPTLDIASLGGGSWVALYNGKDLAGWKSDPGHVGHWQANGVLLTYDGKSTAANKTLFTEKEYGDFMMVVDWRLPGPIRQQARPIVLPNGDEAKGPDGRTLTKLVPYAGDSGILPRGFSKAQINITCNTIGSGELYGYRRDASLPPAVRVAAIPKLFADKAPGEWNRFHITMKGDRITVLLNGQLVIDNAQLPGIPARGPIGLQDHGDPLEFANLYIKEL